MEYNNKPIVVFTVQLYLELMHKGFDPIAVRADKKDPNKFVWVYAPSKEVWEIVKKRQFYY